MDTSPTVPLSDLELAAWRGLLQVHAHGLSVSAYEVLMFLADAPDRRLRMSEIADRVLLSRSGCTRVIDRLAGLGYVTRSVAETDGRGAFAALTATGLERFRAAQRTHREGVRTYFLDRLDATDTVALGDIWTRLEASRA